MYYYLMLLGLFIMSQGFFSGMETGMVSQRRPRVETAARRGSRLAKIMLFFIRNPGVMISTTLLGVNISVVCASLSAKRFAETAGITSPQGLLAVTCCLAVILLCCEIVPKNYFRQDPFRRCLPFIPVLYATYIILFIPVKIFERFTGLLNRVFSGSGGDASISHAVMREDMRLLFREGESGGHIQAEAAAVLDNAVCFHSLTAADFMSAARDSGAVFDTATVADAVKICLERDLSGIPVFSADTPERLVGFFPLYNILFKTDEEKWVSEKVSAYVQPPVFYESTEGIINVINKMRRSSSGCGVAAVRSADGKCAGIISVSAIAGRLFRNPHAR